MFSSRYILVLCACFLFSYKVEGQEIDFFPEAFSIKQGEICRFKAAIRMPNAVDEKKTYRACVEYPEGLNILTPECIAFNQSNAPFTFNIKLLWRRGKQPAKIEFPIKMYLIESESGDTIHEASIKIPVKFETHASLQIKSGDLIFKPEVFEKRLAVNVQVSHSDSRVLSMIVTGPKSVSLQPDVVEFSSNVEIDTTIYITARRERNVLDLDGALVLFELKADENQILASVPRKVSVHTSHMIFTRSKVKVPTGEYFRVKSDQVLANERRHNVTSRIYRHHEHGKDELNWNSMYFEGSRNLLITGTSYKWRHDNHEAELGNVRRRSQAALFGRGLIYDQEHLDYNFSAGYINGVTNLAETEGANSTLTGNSLFAGLTKKHSQNGNFGFQFVNQSRASLNANFIEFTSSMKKGSFKLVGHLAGSRSKHSTNTTVDEKTSGFSIGLNSEFKIRRFQFVTNNYYSSPSFPGFQQGLTDIYNRVVHVSTDWLSVETEVRYNHKTENKFGTGVDPTFLLFVPQTGVLITPTPGVLIRLSGYLMKQENNYADFRNPGEFYSSNGYFGRVQLSVVRKKFTLDALFDQGTGHLDTSSEKIYNTSPRMFRLLLRYGFFQFFANYSVGGRFITEQFREFDSGIKNNGLSLSPQLRIPIQENVLDFNVYGNLTIDAERKAWLQNWQSRISWWPVNHVNVAAGVGLVTNGKSSFLNYSFEARKNIVSYPYEGKSHNVKLKLFFDKNSNGKFDANELPVEGAAVNILSKTLYTDVNGEIKIYRVPKGSHSLDIYDLTGEAYTDRFNIDIFSNKTIYVPLDYNAIISGTVHIESEKFDMVSIEADRINVVAVDAAGKEYRTIIQYEGRYSLRVPTGDYTLYVEAGSLTEVLDVQQNHRKVKASVDRPTRVDFTISSKDRRYNIKKF